MISTSHRPRLLQPAALAVLSFCLLAGTALNAQPLSQEQVDKIGIDQHLDEQLPLNLVFKDEQGQQVELDQYFGSKPVILTLVYYECPMLCTQVLNGLTRSLRMLSFEMSRDYEVVTVSFDPRETSQLAAAKKTEDRSTRKKSKVR